MFFFEDPVMEEEENQREPIEDSDKILISNW